MIINVSQLFKTHHTYSLLTVNFKVFANVFSISYLLYIPAKIPHKEAPNPGDASEK